DTTAVPDHRLHRQTVGVAPGVDGEQQCGRVEVGHHVEGVDVAGGYRFHPHGLPDAGRALVEDPAVGPPALLADRLPCGVGEVGDADDEFLWSGAVQRVGDVRGERPVAALVRGHFASVHIHRRGVVDGTEVQFQPVAPADPPLFGHIEGAAV